MPLLLRKGTTEIVVDYKNGKVSGNNSVEVAKVKKAMEKSSFIRSEGTVALTDTNMYTKYHGFRQSVITSGYEIVK